MVKSITMVLSCPLGPKVLFRFDSRFSLSYKWRTSVVGLSPYDLPVSLLKFGPLCLEVLVALLWGLSLGLVLSVFRRIFIVTLIFFSERP